MNEKRKFELPMTTIVGCGKDADGKYVAHSLDFDLVGIGESEEDSVKIVRTKIKNYIEFGLSQGWDDDMIFEAPEKFFAKLSGNIGILDPIQIDDRKLRVGYVTKPDAVADHAETVSR